MKEAFINKHFSTDSAYLIETVNGILTEYEAQGFKLSLRQVYYQMVARDLLPEKWRDPQTGSKNNLRAYKNLGNLISDGRQAGLIDWDMIEDRGRETVSLPHWENPAKFMEIVAPQFRVNKWNNQPWHIEVMVEKDALSGILIPVCRELDISITANKGYSSSSTMYEIGKRLAYYDMHDKDLCIIYLGDHDPSGIDMTRDVEDRLNLYSEMEGDIEVVRIALNYDQVQLWQPPENPVKDTDARSSSYASQFGNSCWELDAIEPNRLANLLRQEVLSRRDEDAWADAVSQEKEWQAELLKFAESYGKRKK